MSEMFDFKNYQWRKMANNGEKWRKMAMANLPFSFVKFAISPLAPPPPEPYDDVSHGEPRWESPVWSLSTKYGYGTSIDVRSCKKHVGSRNYHEQESGRQLSVSVVVSLNRGIED